MDYNQLLHSLDTENLEYPKDFDLASESSRFFSFCKCIGEDISQFELTNDPSGFQDGSLFTYLNTRNLDGNDTEILFSSFGRFATYEVNGKEERSLEVEACLDANEYVYLPMSVLKTSYNGSHAIIKGRDWFYRYFCDFFRF